jgi:hypothetical protein
MTTFNDSQTASDQPTTSDAAQSNTQTERYTPMEENTSKPTTAPATGAPNTDSVLSADISTEKAAEMISLTEISWKKRRMESAFDRYNQIGDDLDDVSKALRTRLVTDGETEKPRKMTPAEVVTYQARKGDLAISKQEVREKYLQNKREYRHATRHNRVLRRAGFSDNKEETRLLNAIDGMVASALASLDETGRNGNADRVADLRFLAVESKPKDFRKKVTSILTDLNKERWEEPLRFKSVESALTKRIYQEYRRNRANGSK